MRFSHDELGIPRFTLKAKIPQVLFEKGTRVYVFFAAGVFFKHEVSINLTVNPGTKPGTMWRFKSADKTNVFVELNPYDDTDMS
jgi:hypothetical protein